MTPSGGRGLSVPGPFERGVEFDVRFKRSSNRQPPSPKVVRNAFPPFADFRRRTRRSGAQRGAGPRTCRSPLELWATTCTRRFNGALGHGPSGRRWNSGPRPAARGARRLNGALGHGPAGRRWNSGPRPAHAGSSCSCPLPSLCSCPLPSVCSCPLPSAT